MRSFVTSVRFEQYFGVAIALGQVRRCVAVLLCAGEMCKPGEAVLGAVAISFVQISISALT